MTSWMSVIVTPSSQSRSARDGSGGGVDGMPLGGRDDEEIPLRIDPGRNRPHQVLGLSDIDIVVDGDGELGAGPAFTEHRHQDVAYLAIGLRGHLHDAGQGVAPGHVKHFLNVDGHRPQPFRRPAGQFHHRLAGPQVPHAHVLPRVPTGKGARA